MMFDTYKLKRCVPRRLVRAHLCTLAVAAGFGGTWRAAREALRGGALARLLALSGAAAALAAPAALLQLAVGQLSQQDAVGVWSAVPFFKGVGYMRLLVSFLGSVLTVVYMALTVSYFLYTISHSIPFTECVEYVVTEELYGKPYNASKCLDETFLSPVQEQTEYFVAVALIIIVIWVTIPFVLYSPVKWMKRIFYVLSPIVVVLGVVIVSSIGLGSNLTSITKSEDWRHYAEVSTWYRAVTQALMSSQIAGGFLISAGDTIYANTNVQWSAVILVGANILSSWAGVLFWFAIGSGEGDHSPVAVLVYTYNTATERALRKVWPLLIFATLILSGVLTMLSLLYPLFDRCRRVGGHRWRALTVSISLAGAAVTVAVLTGRLPALQILEDYALPFLISIATVLEICAFIFIYGSKVLVEDVEFLTGKPLKKFWLWGWWAVPGVVLALTAWWTAELVSNSYDWTQAPWEVYTLIATMGLAFVIFLVFAGISVAKQMQYDFVGKLRSSFKPSRHWGPRDPITHHYWLARREEIEGGNVPHIRYRRRYLGQFSGVPSFLNIRVDDGAAPTVGIAADVKKRANSDDWLYTGYRRECMLHIYRDYYLDNKRRSKSLDLKTITDVSVNSKTRSSIKEPSVYGTPAESTTSVLEENNNNKDIKKKKRIYFIT